MTVSRSLYVACTGLEERDVFVVRSLLRIIDGRRNTSWLFQENGLANVVIARSSMLSTEREAIERRRAETSCLILADDTGEDFRAPSTLSVRHPVRAAELLMHFDRLENGELLFNSAPEISEKTAPHSQKNALPADSSADVRQGKTETKQNAAAPLPISSLVGALYSQAALGGSGKDIDLFGLSGWIGRWSRAMFEIQASSRFMSLPLDELLRSFGEQALKWRYVEDDVLPVEAGDAVVEVDLDVFSWRVAACFCRNWTMLGLPPHALLRLKRWPDFGALPEVSNRPGILRTAALLTRQVLSLAQLKEEAKAEETDLVVMLSACWLSGLLLYEIPKEIVAEKAPAPEPPPPATKRFGAIVRGIRKVLGLRG